mmetsp:Transcript_122414/g.193906  ORF Transcript_122414/g.193906 Transcript_122414/m.193906 type:complete len:111 (-) Transcript_122414:86-418(-)
MVLARLLIRIGVIFVVDSHDADRMQEAREELDQMLADEDLQNVPLLVFANQKDLPNAMPTLEIPDHLGLENLRSRRWLIQSACATNGDGLLQGLDWLSHVPAGTKRERRE